MKLGIRVLVLIFLFFPGYIWAQQAVRGTVTDAATQQPLSYATVVLLGGAQPVGAGSDSAGNFVINGVAPGRYDLQVSMTGYETYIIKELTVSSAREVVLSVALRESAYNLKEVTVRAGVNKEQPINRMATVSARMLSVEEASRYAGGFDDPARLASAFAGVSSNVGSNGIVVRGNAPKSLQWKMEGVEIPNPNHFADLASFGGGGLTALSSQMLANSDFFTGAFPAEYSNALSGVFDIFMRTGNTQKREHTFQLGAIGIDASSEGPFVKGGKSSYLFNYRYSTLALLAPVLPDNAGGVRYQDLSFKLNFPTKKAGTFSLWGIGLQDYSGADVQKDTLLMKYVSDREEQKVNQYMGATGLTHKLLLKNGAYLRTTLAATVSGLDMKTSRLDNTLILLPQNRVENTYTNLVLNSFINKRFGARHTNRTGIILTGLTYNQQIKDALSPGVLTDIVNSSGSSALLAAYSQSSVHLTEKLSANAGVTGQVFTLNGRYTIEPRIGLRYQLSDEQSLGVAYGLHSRLERLNFYFIQLPASGSEFVNKDLDFTKASHVVLSYDRRLSKNVHLKIEPWYQDLFNVAVVAGTPISLINLQSDFFFAERLENTGKGQNYGIDVTLEKYMSHGYYAMFTGSIFSSRYTGGDGIWRDTRFHRSYVFNLLGGKEWQKGRTGANVLGLNARVSYQGGERYTPVNYAASATAGDVVYNDANTFGSQFSPAFVVHLTASYKINRKAVAHTIALKVINATMYPEFEGFKYNYLTGSIDETRQALIVPNISYKIEF